MVGADFPGISSVPRNDGVDLDTRLSDDAKMKNFGKAERGTGGGGLTVDSALVITGAPTLVHAGSGMEVLR